MHSNFLAHCRGVLILMALITVILAFGVSERTLAGTYPKDGIFKQLPVQKDYWFYVDQVNWDIVAPDKWTHMMGSMGSTALFSRFMNKYAAGALVFALGVFKEYDDGYREGWSYRDLIANTVGITASLTATERYQILADYDRSSVTFLVNFIID
jgi:hypothetical protein